MFAVLLTTACIGATGCGDEGAGPPSTTTFTFTTLSPVTPTTSPTPSCAVRLILEGVPSEEIAQTCELEALVDDIIQDVRLRAAIAEGINRAVPGATMDAPLVVEWAEYACDVGAPAVTELVTALNPTSAQRFALFSPLIDFSAAAASDCGGDALRDALAGAVWREVMPAPTVAEVEALLQTIQLSTTASQLMEGVHEPCDLVGNAGALLVERLANSDNPEWMDLVLGELFGFVCGEVLG